MHTESLIKWQNTIDKPEPQACALCNSINTTHQLNVKYENDIFLSVYKCNKCNSRFYPEIFESRGVEYYSDNLEHKNFQKYYIQVGAGISFIIEIINRIPEKNIESFIDIGCSVGFSVDYVKNHLNKKAVGIEPSDYGRTGSRLFSTTIYNNLIQNEPNLFNKTFSVIFSSEVLEHVFDPHEFLKLLINHLNNDGILILTTPNAEYIEPIHPENQVYSALFPGEHKILFSKKTLHQALTMAGFSHINLDYSNSKNLIAYASRQPLTLTKGNDSHYAQYLTSRLNMKDTPSLVSEAYRSRLLMYLVENKKFDEVSNILDHIYSDIGINKNNIPEELDYVKSINDFINYGDFCSYMLGPTLYYLAFYEQKIIKNNKVALPLSKLALDIITKEISLGNHFFQISQELYPRAALQHIQLLSVKNNIDWQLLLEDFITKHNSGMNSKTRNKFLKEMKRSKGGYLKVLFSSRRKSLILKLIFNKILHK